MNDITFVITAHCMKKEPTNSSHIIKTIQSFNLIKHFNNTKFLISFDGNKYPDLEKQYDTFKHDIRIYLNLHFDSSQYKMIYHSQNIPTWNVLFMKTNVIHLAKYNKFVVLLRHI